MITFSDLLMLLLASVFLVSVWVIVSEVVRRE